MGITPNDRRLFMLDAYLMPFDRDIKKAKKHFEKEISDRVNTLEKKTTKKTMHWKAIQAVKEEKNTEYFLAFMQVSNKYKPTERLALQKATYLAIRNIFPREENPKPSRLDSREDYAKLAKSYGQNSMYEIRQRLERGEATEEEMLAFFSFNIQEMYSIRKIKTARCAFPDDRLIMQRILRTLEEDGKLEKITEKFEEEMDYLQLKPDQRVNKILLKE